MSFLFGSNKTTSELPAWIQAPTKEMLQRSIDMGKTGYMPWAGPDVAAIDPATHASWENTNQAANAFGMASAMPYVPEAQEFAGGVRGYSTMPAYDQQMDWMRENRPGQLDFYNSFFVDPTTGAPGSNMGQQQQPLAILNGIAGMRDDRDNRDSRSSDGAFDTYGQGNAERGGFSSFGDALGGIGNAIGGAIGGIRDARDSFRDSFRDSIGLGDRDEKSSKSSGGKKK